MHKLLKAVVGVLLVGLPAAQANQIREYFATERDLHHRILSQPTISTNSSGRIVASTNSYTELQTGMYFLRDGQWLESRAEILLTADGAAATNCAYPVRFAADLHTYGAVDLTLPDDNTCAVMLRD